MVKTFYEKFCRPTLKRLEDPMAAQEACLRKILKRCKGTLFGKQHGFGDIRSIEEFQNKVPILTYESMQPYISKIANGEQNILYPDETLVFMLSAGTTGTPKYFPFGAKRYEELVLDGLIGSVFFIVHTGHYDVMDGAILSMRAPPRLGQKFGIYDVSFFSGAITNVPPPHRLKALQRFQTGSSLRSVPPREVDLVRDYDTKYYLTARYSVAADVRAASGVTSKLVFQLIKTSTEYLDRFLADPELDAKTKTKLRKACSDGVIDLKSVWPNFRVVLSGGTSATPYQRMIHDLLGDCCIWETFGATEVSVGYQIFPDQGIVLSVDRCFFEFIPDDEEDSAAVPLSDVKTNTPYRIIVTSNGGFYRYDLGDLVTFVDLEPPVFGEISRKKALVNLGGERLSEEVFLRVIERSCEQFGIDFVEFALLPEFKGKTACYHLYIEFMPNLSDLEGFTGDLDRRLRTASFFYDLKRKQGVFTPPVIIPVRLGGFDFVLQKLGKDSASGKMPRLLTPELSRMIPTLPQSS